MSKILCVCVICYINLRTSTSWENLISLKGIHICTQSWMTGSFFELAMVRQVSSCCWVYMEIWTECKRDIVWPGWRIASRIVVPISVSINESCAKTCKNPSSAYPWSGKWWAECQNAASNMKFQWEVLQAAANLVGKICPTWWQCKIQSGDLTLHKSDVEVVLGHCLS